MTTGALQQVMLATERPLKVLTYQTQTTNVANLTTYVFTAQAIGTAAADRHVIAGVRFSGNTQSTVLSATIGGVAATIVNQTTAGSNVAALIVALVTAGTTADISVTIASSALRAGCGVWSAVGLRNAAAHTSVASIATTAIGTLSVVPDGFIVAIASENAASTYSWAGVTERFDQTDAESASSSGADTSQIVGTTLITVIATYATPDPNRAFVAASW